MGKRIQFGGGEASARFDTFGHGSPRWGNAQNGQGTSMDREPDTMFLPGAPLPSFTTEALMQFQGIARRIVTREPDDAMREGIDFEGLSPDEKTRMSKELKRLKAIQKVKKARMFEHAYGGGAVLCFVADGREPHEPVDVQSIRKVTSLYSVDCKSLHAHEWEDRPSSSQFGDVRSWILQGMQAHRSGAPAGTVFHHSRVLDFDGLEISDVQRICNRGWGGSRLDLVWSALSKYGSTHQFAAEAVSLFTQGVFKTDLAKALQADGADELVERFMALRQGMGILGDLVLDKKEEYEIMTRPLQGITDALAAFASYLVAATDMPRSILFGESPGGMNSGENAGETRSWYDHVASGREESYTPAFEKLGRYLFAARNGLFRGRTPSLWSVVWPELWQLTDLERADLRGKRAVARKIDIEAGVITEDEARQDPDVAETYPIDPSEPAPGMPGTPGGQGGFGGDGDGLDEGDALDEVESAILVPAPVSKIPTGEKLKTARQLGDELGVNPSRIRSWAARGLIDMFRPGGTGPGLYLHSQLLTALGAIKADAARGGSGSGPFAGTATG